MKFFVAVVFGLMVVFSAFGATAEDVPVATFDRTLEVLRQSVVDLVKENKDINVRNIEIRARIKELDNEIRSLQADTLRLEKKKAAEEQRAQTHVSGADALKGQVAQADDVLKQIHAAITARQERLGLLEQESLNFQQKAEKLAADITAMNKPGISSDAARLEIAALEAEREALDQALREAGSKVQEAKQEWESASALAETGPGQVDALKVEQDSLAKALPQLEADLASIDVQLSEGQAVLDRLQGDDYSDMRVGRLQSEVRDMAERDRKLKAEIMTTQKNSEAALKRYKEGREKARKQYESEYKEVLQRNEELKVELDSLRKQMVDLDKKKSSLEAAIYTSR